MPIAQAAATAASRLSTLTPAWVARQMVSRPARAERFRWCRWPAPRGLAARTTALPPAAWCAASCGGLRVGGIEDDGAVAQRRQPGHARIGGIEHGGAVGQHHVDLGAQHLDHLLAVLDVELGQLAGAVEVGDDADRAAVVGQAVGQDAAGAVLDHRRLHRAVDQQAVAGFPVGAVARVDAAALEEQAVAAGQADVAARPGRSARRPAAPARPCLASRPRRPPGCGPARCPGTGDRRWRGPPAAASRRPASGASAGPARH